MPSENGSLKGSETYFRRSEWTHPGEIVLITPAIVMIWMLHLIHLLLPRNVSALKCAYLGRIFPTSPIASARNRQLNRPVNGGVNSSFSTAKKKCHKTKTAHSEAVFRILLKTPSLPQ
ncbi:hypothetical protein, variant [Blastomyces dermatitidis ER-3]|uniref:Uncharacterized protein n=1 Tax=Ajellomyces dermatitidis (strain ER-3 / ATCC MYA-2586) TaxID=559297 RepID=A0ABX2VX97_AJEDR|nr:uncharacterized protein BDCG_17229 [Blastomyces dermatitidis ER-3]XP_045281510.1 hypothetical protein, variant [Blastomyces dermatitidis ER-3]OAT01782.1 hypothetical protein BDCG_17229 [Blastomyces dermatitidis ER-3]OAT01783.1 hypothetical protein, variant [Blastomyces dermatitidis ER-3]